MSTTTEWWVDGHFIVAWTPKEAIHECVRLYDHEPEQVRPWTAADQAELDRVTR